MTKMWTQVLFIGFCTAVLVFLGAMERPLTKSSEGRVARVAQEMFENPSIDAWIVPHLNGVVRLEKPPFSSWLVALTAKVAGASEVKAWHAYVPPGLATIALVFFVFFWVRSSSRSEDAACGCGVPAAAPMWSALILATAPGFLLQARSAEIDMLLALWVTLMVWGLYQWRVKGCGRALVLAYIGTGLSIHTKGHVGIVVAVPAVLIWHAWESTKMSLSPRRVAGWRWHLLGVGICLALVLPWAIPFLQKSGLTWEVFRREGIDRFDKSTGHQEPFYWYFQQVPGWFLPWTVLFVIALWQTRGLPPDERSPLRRLCASWLGWGMLLFSVMAAKQRHYAIVFFPPLAILMGDAIARWLAHPEERRQAAGRTVLAGFCAMLSMSMIALAAVAPKVTIDAKEILVIAVIGAGVFVMAAVKALKARTQCVALLWAGFVCAVAIFAQTFEAKEARDESAEAFGRYVRSKVPADATLYDFGVTLPSNRKVWKATVLFYLGRKVVIDAEGSPVELLNPPGGVAYGLMTQREFEKLPEGSFIKIGEQRDFLGEGRGSVYLVMGRKR